MATAVYQAWDAGHGWSGDFAERGRSWDKEAVKASQMLLDVPHGYGVLQRSDQDLCARW